MALLINKTIEAYKHVFTDLADPRVNNWFLVSSPIPVIAIAASYLHFCTSYGPRYMRDRKPYELKRIVMVYNIFQVLLSTYLFKLGASYMLSKEFNFQCSPMDYSNNPMAIYLASAGWWYFFAKITELLDTVFFVLRKKNNQVSFLHVYHHTLMCLGSWATVKYLPGGSPVVMGTLNSFVHIVMYTYYFIAGLGPEYQKYIWWKRHVTVLQLVQFTIILYHNVNTILHDCAYPKFMNVILCGNSLLFLYLFGKFYIASYTKSKGKEQKMMR